MPNGAKNWCFTLNRRTGQDDDSWALVIATTSAAGALDSVGYLVFQVERGGEVQREHLQGYVQLKKRTTLPAVKANIIKNGEVHLEVARGSPASNKTYCTKDDDRVAGPFEFGSIELVQAGRRTDIEHAAELVLAEGMAAVASAMPATFIRYHRGLQALKLLHDRCNAPTVRSEVAVAVLHGPTNLGKTYAAMTLDAPEHTYVLPIQNKGSLWFDGYRGQRTLVIDDFDPLSVPYRSLLRILDRYRLDTPSKGNYVAADWSTVILTANFHPCTWYAAGAGVDFYDDGPLERRLSLIHAVNSRNDAVAFETVFFLTFAAEDHITTEGQGEAGVAGNTDAATPASPGHVATDAAAAPDDVMSEPGDDFYLESFLQREDSATQSYETDDDAEAFQAFLDDLVCESEDSVGF